MSDQAAILALLRAVGCTAWSTADNRRTHLPRGFPDIVFCSPKLRAPACWEVKAPNEPISDAQLKFENDWLAGHGEHGWGDVNDARQWLKERGLLK